MKLILIIGTVLVASAGIGAGLLLNKSGDDMRGAITIAEIAVSDEAKIPEPTQAQQDFQSLAVAKDKTPECSLPKPPKSIGETALTRNSLRQVLRIIALQKWQETGSCDCFYGDISWDDVIHAAPNFERTDGVDLRFDLSSLREQGAQLDVQRLKACPE